MISKERLEELIKQETTIYGITNDKEILKIGTKHLHHPKEFGTDKEIFNIFSCCYEDENGTNVFNVEYSNIYETKEEAEFVARNYDTRIEKFEPPFELCKGKYYEFVSKEYGNAEIYHSFENGCYEVNDERYDFGEYEIFDTYQKAVDYAHKLFEGE